MAAPLALGLDALPLHETWSSPTRVSYILSPGRGYRLLCNFGASCSLANTLSTGILFRILSAFISAPQLRFRGAARPWVYLESATGARTFLSAASRKCSTITPLPRAVRPSDAAAHRNVRAPAWVGVGRCAVRSWNSGM